MIVKYLSGNVWGYIDNIRQVASTELDVRKAVLDYDSERHQETQEAEEKGWPIECDACEYMNGEKLPEEIITSNKAFMKATENQSDWGNNVHCENLIDGEKLDFPASTVLLYVEEHKEFDTIGLITNQKVYLMNDKGQTIERLN